MTHLSGTSRSRRRWLAGTALLLTALAASACDDAATAPSSNDVRVSVTSGTSAVRPGSTVNFTLINNTGRNFEFNLCANARLERDNNGSWETASPPAQVCNLSIQLLVPNGRLDAAWSLPATLAAGRYRITVTMRDGNSAPVVISSEVFTVAP